MAIKTAKQLVAACLDVVNNHKTMYILSCFGAPMQDKNKARYAKADPKRAAEIMAAEEDRFGFDCVGFIKGLFWGWKGDPKEVYGGAVYKSNGVPDIGADQLIKQCAYVSEDFTTIVPGEYVWLPGHGGIYVGDGLAAEATFEPVSGVQLQAVLPMGEKPGYPATGWVKHGKLPWLSYEEETVEMANRYRVTVEGVDGEFLAELKALAKRNGCALTVDAIAAETPAEPVWTPDVGDIVYFKGGLQYGSANGSVGKERPAGIAEITKTAPGKLHPWHLKKTGKTGPYGWVDRDTFEKM